MRCRRVKKTERVYQLAGNHEQKRAALCPRSWTTAINTECSSGHKSHNWIEVLKAKTIELLTSITDTTVCHIEQLPSEGIRIRKMMLNHKKKKKYSVFGQYAGRIREIITSNPQIKQIQTNSVKLHKEKVCYRHSS